MNRVRMAWNVALLLLAGTSLFAGLTLLDASPLSSVLIIVGAMGFLMSHTGRARLRWPLVYAEARGDLPICTGSGNRITHCGGLFASTTRRR